MIFHINLLPKDSKVTSVPDKELNLLIEKLVPGFRSCALFETDLDLLELLAQFFKEGLMNHEFCLCLLPEQMSSNWMTAELKSRIPKFDEYLIQGQIELLTLENFYFKGGSFEQTQVLNLWLDKINETMKKGGSHFRIATPPLPESKTTNERRAGYEAELNRLIDQYNLLFLGVYRLPESPVSLLEILSHHRNCLYKKDGRWTLSGNSELDKAIERIEREVDDLKREIEENHLILSSIQRIARIGLWEWDLKTDEHIWSKELYRLYGVNPDNQPKDSRRFISLLVPEDRDRVEKILKNTLFEGAPLPSFECRLLLGSSRMRPLLIESEVLNYDDTGKPLRILGTAKDITDKTNLELSLDDLKNKFDMLFQTKANGFAIFKSESHKTGITDFEFIEATEGFKFVFGLEGKEISGTRFSEILLNKSFIELGIRTFETGQEIRTVFFDPNTKKNHCLHFFRTELKYLIVLVVRLPDSESPGNFSSEDTLDILNLMNLGILLYTPTGQIQFANSAAIKLLGNDLDGLLRRAVRENGTPFSPEDWPPLISLNKGFFVEGIAGVFKKPDKPPVWIRISSIPRFTKTASSPFQICTFIEDLTLVKQAEKKHKELTQSLNKLSDQLKDQSLILDMTNVMIWNETDGIISWSKGMEKCYGWTEEEVLSKHPHSLLKTEFDRPYNEILEEFNRNHHWEGQPQHTKKNGTRMTVSSRWIHCPDKPGKTKAIAETNIDISQFKITEQALIETNEYFDNLFNFANIPIFCWDKEYSILRVNHSFELLTLYKMEEVLGYDLRILFPEEDKEDNLNKIFSALKANPPQSLEIKISRKDKEIRTVLCSSMNIYSNNRKTILSTISQCQDITCRKETEEILKRDKETFEKLVDERTEELLMARTELDRAKHLSDLGILAASIAHELRSPLAAIGLAAENIRRKASSPQIERNILSIEKKVNDSNQIINNLLYYSRIKPPSIELINLCEIIQESLELTLSRFADKQARIINNLKDYKIIYIKADPLQIKEVFNNIFQNAFDAIPNEGIITLEIIFLEKYVEICVRDNGCGIHQENLDKIFAPFFTTKSKGTGLGLAVCYQIVKHHHGNIVLRSEYGKGTEVCITLPK